MKRSAEDIVAPEPSADAKRTKGDAGEAQKPAADPALLQKVEKQLNFYFGDSNFARDKFLKAEAAKVPDGLVPISVLLTFNKLKQMTTEVSVVSQAAKNSERLTVSEDGLRIGRARELPEGIDSRPRLIFVKGFGYKNSELTVDLVSSIFSVFGEVTYVKVRRNDDKDPKGSVFIEFATEEGAQSAIAGQDSVSYKDKPFELVCSFEEHDRMKKAEHEVRMEKREARRIKALGGSSSAAAAANGDAADMDVEEAPARPFVPGLLLRIKGLPLSGVSWEELKQRISAVGTVAFVDCDRGQTEGILRFRDAETASCVLAAFSDGLEMTPLEPEPSDSANAAPDAPPAAAADAAAADAPAVVTPEHSADNAPAAAAPAPQPTVTLTLHAMTPAEEQAYSRTVKAQNDAKNANGGGGGGRGRRGRGGRGRGGRGRGGGRGNNRR